MIKVHVYGPPLPVPPRKSDTSWSQRFARDRIELDDALDENCERSAALVKRGAAMIAKARAERKARHERLDRLKAGVGMTAADRKAALERLDAANVGRAKAPKPALKAWERGGAFVAEQTFKEQQASIWRSYLGAGRP